MKLILCLLCAAICTGSGQKIPFFGNTLSAIGTSVGNAIFNKGCDRDVTFEFRKNFYDFCTRLYHTTSPVYHDNFQHSQYSAWLSLAALAEAAEGKQQQQLFQALRLPAESCLRKKYYAIMRNMEVPGEDVILSRKRYLVLDESLRLNATWADQMRSLGVIDFINAPLKRNFLQASDLLRQLINAKIPNPDFRGNSILIDSLDYRGLWTESFPKDKIERNAPFYDDFGNAVGTCDYLKIKKRVKLAYLPLLDGKVLALPVGKNSRYYFLMLINLSKTPIGRTVQLMPNTIILDIFDALLESVIPLEIKIPLINVTTELGDMADLLRKMENGAKDIWESPIQYVSQPAAATTAYVQRISLYMDHRGVEESREEQPSPLQAYGSFGNIVSTVSKVAVDAATGLVGAVGRDFIANRPFMYALVDSDTRSVHFGGVYSKPPAL